MYTFKAVIVLLATLVLFAVAHPINHVHRRSAAVARTPRRRSTCHPRSSGSSSSAVTVAPTPTNAAVKDNQTPSSSSRPSKTSSVSEAPSATGTSAPDASPAPQHNNNSGAKTGISALFPVGDASQSWSTSSSASNVLSLSDSTFRPNHVLSALSHDIVSAPDGKKAMKAHYPKGSYNFQHFPQGGFSFYAPGPSSVDLTSAKEATFGYSVFFEEGFQFNLGGKLPGLYGGNSDEEAIGCSGGRRSTACFSARLMWRTNGAGEFYTYLPPFTDPRFSANKKQCNVEPQSDCNPTYGASIGRGSFKFRSGAWTTVAERVRLNDVGKANGELELFVDGKSVINLSGLILRDSAAGKMRGLQMQTFFGGSHPEFASPKDQNVYFSDFSVAITETL